MSAITKEAVRRLIEQRLQIDAVPCPAGTFEDAVSILTMIRENQNGPPKSLRQMGRDQTVQPLLSIRVIDH